MVTELPRMKALMVGVVAVRMQAHKRVPVCIIPRLLLGQELLLT